jgi:hypothetical protein
MYREHEVDACGQPAAHGPGSGGLSRRSFLVAGTAAAATAALSPAALAQSALTAGEVQTKFSRLSLQAKCRPSSIAFGRSSSRRWVIQTKPPGATHNCGVCGVKILVRGE